MVNVAVEKIVSHILLQLSLRPTVRPLFVAIQGPQGSGKSYLTARVHTILTSKPYGLRVASLSLDDLYLPHSGLRHLASLYPENALWCGRGLPGTHDVQLAVNILGKLSHGDLVELPRFDKSLHNGEGDRLPIDGTGTLVQGLQDVVIMEGWCIGFRASSVEEIEEKWGTVWMNECQKLNLPPGLVKKEDILAVNESLKRYEDIWAFFDTFVQIKPLVQPADVSEYTLIYRWRLEQEVNMKAKNGGRGMSVEEVKSFVDRYIPGYIFFGEGVTAGGSQWTGYGYRVCIDEGRQVQEVNTF